MEWTAGNALAMAVARYARLRLHQLERGAVLIRLPDNESLGVAIIGNDGYANDFRVRQEVRLLRCAVEEAGLDELGFGIEAEGRAWALLVKAQATAAEMRLGPRMHLTLFLEEAVWAAWRVACGLPPETGAPGSENLLGWLHAVTSREVLWGANLLAEQRQKTSDMRGEVLSIHARYVSRVARPRG